MKEWEELLQVADRLLADDGCPWDREQTFQTLKPFILEEAQEVVEAVDLDKSDHIAEELGDLLYVILFYAKLGRKLGRFGIEDVLSCVKEKLIRRHPHVFGDVKVESMEDIRKNWERIKKEEKAAKINA